VNKKKGGRDTPLIVYVYCPATTAHVSYVPELPAVPYAKRKFFVVDATAEALPVLPVSEGEMRVSVPLQIPAPATAVGTAILFN